MTLLQQIPILPDSVPDHKAEIEMLKSMPVDELLDKLVTSMVTFAINLLIAIVVFYVGRFIINKIHKVLASIMVRRRVDKSLSTFVLSLVRMLLYFLLIVTVIGILGIETSSFIALFASAGVAIGMALSGTLQNFAGGVLILLLKPYKIGDYIEAQGYAGYVTEIQIFHTIIATYDNKSIIIPNGGLSTGSINNWNREDYRRVEWSVAISYGDDVAAARKAILDMLLSDKRVVTQYIEDDRQMRQMADKMANSVAGEVEKAPAMKRRNWLVRLLSRNHLRVRSKLDKWDNTVDEQTRKYLPKVNREPKVVVKELADSSVVLSARAWTRIDFYWNLFYDMNERIYNELPLAGIHFPFPQLDVHLPEFPQNPDNHEKTNDGSGSDGGCPEPDGQ